MKRIYLSILVILGTVALTVGAAYAYFTSNAVSLTGVTLASATPLLRIGPDGSNWDNSITGNSESLLLRLFPLLLVLMVIGMS